MAKRSDAKRMMPFRKDCQLYQGRPEPDTRTAAEKAEADRLAQRAASDAAICVRNLNLAARGAGPEVS